MSDKLDFLAFGAHPDDVELGCGATIAKLVSQGKKVGIVDLTKGELGTRGSAEIRTKETNEASKILGITVRENMDFKDGFFRNDEEHQLKIIQVIRKYQPDFVFCNAPDDRHIEERSDADGASVMQRQNVNQVPTRAKHHTDQKTQAPGQDIERA